MNRREKLKDKEHLLELFNKLNELHDVLDSNFIKYFNRSLPFSECIFDRWERAKKLNFGNDSSIYDSALVIGNVRVGSNTWIGPFVLLDGSGNLEIGNNCSISAGVQIYTHDSVKWAISGGKEKYEYAPTKIGDNCYIGPNTVIIKGISLGTGCIVGANSFVNKSFPAGYKIAGNPAKVIK